MIVLPRLRLLSGTIAYRPARIPPFICGARLARWSEGDSGVFKVALLYRRNNPVLTFKTFAFFEEIDCLPGCARYLAAGGNISIGALKSSQLVTHRYDCVAGNVSQFERCTAEIRGALNHLGKCDRFVRKIGMSRQASRLSRPAAASIPGRANRAASAHHRSG